MNTWNLETEAERKADKAMKVAEFFLFMVAGLVGVLPLGMSYGGAWIAGIALSGLACLSISGLALGRASRLDQC